MVTVRGRFSLVVIEADYKVSEGDRKTTNGPGSPARSRPLTGGLVPSDNRLFEVDLMDMKQENWDEEWSGLEPSQSRTNRWGCWLGGTVLLLLVLVLCVAGSYLAWQQFELQLGPGLVLVPPTALTNKPEADESSIPQAAAEETPALAPTVTLPAAQEGVTVEAWQMAQAPVIDGNLGEWQELATIESGNLVFNTDGWDRTDDVSALWRLGWDSQYLFIGVQVTDDTHVQTQTGNQIFRGDGVSLQIDTDFEGDYGPGLSRDDYQINLSPGDFVSSLPVAFRFRGTSDGGTEDALGHQIVVEAQRTGLGYEMEAAIPWQDLSLAPSPGLVIGVALNVNDNDTPGTAVQEVMKSHVATRTYSDPSSWGSLRLR